MITSSSTTSLNEGTPTHPKVQTEHKEDVLFLQKTMKDAVSATLQLKKKTWSAQYASKQLPPELLQAVHHEMNEWVDQVFQVAAPNITINGLDYDDAFKITEELEPLNDSLVEHADTLFQDMMTQLLKMTSLRKNVLEQIHTEADADSQRNEQHFNILMEGIECFAAVSQAKGTRLTDDAAAEFEQYVKNLGMESQLSKQLKELMDQLQSTEEPLPSIISRLEKAQVLLDELNVVQASNDGETDKSLRDLNDENRSSVNEGYMMNEDKKSMHGVSDETLTPRTARSGLLSELRK